MDDAAAVLASVGAAAGRAIDARSSDAVAPAIDEQELKRRLDIYDFVEPRPLAGVVDDLVGLLRDFAVRSDHPRYFGLFNPPALVPAIAGDMIASSINPQLAVWEHAPAAAEIERKLIALFGGLAWNGADAVGTFTNGGSEANATALLAAIARRHPDWDRNGIPREGLRPAIYASSEAHLAWIKIARNCGLGSDAVRLVPSADGMRMTGEALALAIDRDTEWTPVLVVATAGTTAHGSIDDLSGVAEVGRRNGAHVHCDAAWAGGVLLHPERAKLLAGIDQCDSITIDPHKWLSVPMGAGMFLARDWGPLARAFAVSTGYMPSASVERRDAYIHSLQWSRRFIGAKLFTALATLGVDGYRSLIERSFELADYLRAKLEEGGWRLLNNTELPLVCFAPAEGGDEVVRAIAAAVVASGAAWISVVKLQDRLVLRACITSFESTESDVDALVASLKRATGR